MGILNVTPDSFFDGGQYCQLERALRQVERMVAAGATLVDVGGESSRPGASVVGVYEEMRRVMPVVKAIAARFAVWISIDTYKPEVMLASADAGAHLINDIHALRMPGALAAAAETGLSVCLMHLQGQPATMQENPTYQRIIHEVSDFFRARIDCCVAAGLPRQRLLIDPGFGFGKTLQHNYQLLSQLTEFRSLEIPLLVGLSRKSMIGKIIKAQPSQSLRGSVAAAVIAAMQGARIIRVHDVKETIEALRIVSEVLVAKSEAEAKKEKSQ